MPAEIPTIVATSGGLTNGRRTRMAFAPMLLHALELSGAAGRPTLCSLETAGGDQRTFLAELELAGEAAGVTVRPLHLFPMPNVDDLTAYLLEHDVVWVGGGSVANLLALWRLHGLDEALRTAWQAGVVLAGVSAGSICWHAGGTTDSFGPDLRPVTDGLGFLPYANGVHYDSEAQRRPLFRSLIAEGVLPDGYATDDGAGLVYRGTELVEVVSEVRGACGYAVRRQGDEAVEERLEARLLPGAR